MVHGKLLVDRSRALWGRTHARLGVEGWCAILIVAGLASFFPHFPKIHSANERSRLFLAEAMVVDHTASIDGAMKRWGGTPDKSRRDGRYYSDKAPGVAFAMVPALWVYVHVVDEPTLSGEMRLGRLVVSTLPTLALLLGLIGLLREKIEDRGLRLALLIAYGAGSLATTYSILLFGHQLSAVLVFGLFLVIRRADPNVAPPRAMVVGCLAAAAVIVEYQNALFLVPLAIFYLVRVRGRLSAILFALAGMVPLTVALLVYHHVAFGSPLKTGYSFLVNQTFRSVHARGFLGIELPRLDHAFLSFLSPAKGLFFFSPFLLVGVAGLFILPRRSDAWVTGAMVVMYALFVSAMVFPGGGWTVSQRHLTPLVPWLLWPAGAAVVRWRWLRAPFIGLVVVSVLITAISTVVWPYLFDALQNPFFQLAWPLFRDEWLPPSVMSPLGVPSRLLFCAWLLLAFGALARALWSWYPASRTRALALVVGCLWIPLHLAAVSWIAAKQDVRQFRARVERDYVLDPSATPVYRVTKPSARATSGATSTNERAP